MKDGKPAGVVINGEKEVYAKRFICNSSPDKVWSDLFDLKDIPERQLKMLNARTTSVTLTTVYLGMNKTIDELGIKDYSTFIAPVSDSDEQFKLVTKYFSGYCIINCLNKIIPDCTPEGTSQLFLTAMTFGDVMKGVKPEDYKKFKTKVAEDMIKTCEKALNISIMPYIEEIEIALPPTFSRYLIRLSERPTAICSTSGTACFHVPFSLRRTSHLITLFSAERRRSAETVIIPHIIRVKKPQSLPLKR